MKLRISIATLIGAALLASSPSFANDLETHLDRTRVGTGESIALTLRLRGASTADEPDLRPLRGDFEVLDVATSVRTRIINGQRDASVDWRISLLPLRAGRLEVPSLRVGSRTSAPHEIEVLERSEARAAAVTARVGQPVFIEAEVDVQEPYVQGEVTLTVRLHADDRVLDGALSEPSAAGAIIERVGQDRNYRTLIGEREYAVVERSWSIFPQRSGPLEISPVQFQGTIRGDQRRGVRDPFAEFFGGSRLRGSLFDEFFGPTGQPVRVHSAALALDVRPKPAEAQGQWWVPARDVVLIEQWEDDPPAFKVGEPVNRLVAIRAAGISVAQLPDLELPSVEGLKQYSEPPVEETVAIGNEVVAVKARTTTLIPTRPGPLVLPAVELEWWDTAADAPRTASLPERTIQVAGGSGLAGASPATPARPTPPADRAAGAAPATPAPEAAQSISALPNAPLVVGALAAVVVAAAAALGWSLARRRAARAAQPASSTGTSTSPAPGAVRLRDAEKTLQRACDAGDPDLALGSLAAVARLRWPDAPPLNAADWARRLASDELTRAVEEVQRVRYSQERGAWSGDELWQTYSRARRSKRSARKRDRTPLPALYPTGARGQTPA